MLSSKNKTKKEKEGKKAASNERQDSQKKKLKYEINPLKLCLKYNPPTIGYHYNYKGREPKKTYVHEVKVDLSDNANSEQVVDKLFKGEPLYFNPKKISKQQVYSSYLFLNST
jgi:hypothetical protein